MRQRILALLLAALGALAWWHDWTQPPADIAGKTTDRVPDYTVDNLTATILDETGAPARKIVATELRHYPIDDTTELEQPRLTEFDEAAPPWRIRSASAWISADGEDLLLRGKVFIDREPDETNRPVHLRTRELLVRPRRDYAETDQPVLLTSGADWVTAAGGARVWFGEAPRVELTGRARMQFDLIEQPSETPEESP